MLKKMRKLTGVFFAVLVIFAMSGCSSEESSSTDGNDDSSSAEKEVLENTDKDSQISYEVLSSETITYYRVEGDDGRYESATMVNADDEKMAYHVIEIKVRNHTDKSLEIKPTLTADVDHENVEGEINKTTLTIETGFFSPQGMLYGGTFTNSSNIAIAPNEEKIARIYIYNDLRGKIKESKYYKSKEIVADNAVNFKISDVNVYESKYTIVPNAEWGKDLSKIEVTDADSKYNNGYYLTGSIKNETDVEWKDAHVQFDVLTNGPVYSDALEVRLSYVDPGDARTFGNSEDDDKWTQINIYDENVTEVEAVPALLYFEKVEE